MSTSQHIYICYSREDTAIMQRIRTSLQRVGLKVWTGETLDQGSDQWKKEIPRAVHNASTILVLMSPAANHSEWITRELSVARSLHIEILPLLVAGEVHQSLHPAVATMEYIDLRDDYEKGMVQVIRLCYEYRQQVDLRSTMELRIAMDTETPEEATGQPEVVTPEVASQEVKLFVSRVAAEVSKPDKQRASNKPKVKAKPEPTAQPSRLRLMLGIGLIVGGLIAAVVVAILLLNPFGSDAALTAVAVADTTEESTEAVEVTVESQVDVPTETPEPSSTPRPTATRVPPTQAPTNVPPTQAPTLAPTATPEPTDIPASSTPIQPSDTPAPTAIPVITDGNIEIRYNGDTIVVHNISDSDVSLAGVAFVLVGADAANSVLFLAEEWGMTNNILQNDRCAQIWRVEFAEIPASEPPANECGARSAFRSTPRTFWIADGNKTVFELRRNNEVLAQCEAARRNNNTIMTCMADI